MALYGAMYEILVSEGPLDGLFLDRLPDEQVHEVDVVHISQGGPPPQRYLGSSPVMNGPVGVETDGGVLWNKSSIEYQCRSVDPLMVMEVADWVRDLLVQFSGGSLIRGGEEVIRCDLTASPHYFGQDEQERIVMALSFEVWHKAA